MGEFGCVYQIYMCNQVQHTSEVKENAFWLDKTGQNVHIFEEVLFFQATFNLLCVLELFSECWPSTLFQFFLFFYV